MSEEAKETPAAEKPAAEKPAAEKPASKGGSPPLLLIGVAVGALAAGGALGGLLIGPRLTAGRVAPAVHAAEAGAESEPEPEAEQEGHDEKGKHGEKNHSAVVRLENLIVNPAGSQGTRFLMATVAFEVRDSKVEARLRDHEVQVRDIVMTALESHTLEMLTAPGARDSVKQRLVRAVAPIAGQRVKVFLPQFVIQ